MKGSPICLHRLAIAAVLGLAIVPCEAFAQRVPDLAADTIVAVPAFPAASGPTIAIDGGHHNFHTLEGRFAPFAKLARADGFRSVALTSDFSAAALQGVDILVVANALDEANVERWALPTPSAFTPAEIAAVNAWVEQGGALLLIADHLPFAGAAQDLAQAFGFSFVNGFALQAPVRTSDLFTLDDGTLRDSVVVRGRSQGEVVDKVATFTGSAFKAPPEALPVLAFSKDFFVLTPETAWESSEAASRKPATGYLQGAVMVFGKGRVAVFGEGGLFTAQLDTDAAPWRIGFNAPEAAENKQFILNVLHWLAGILPDE